MPCSRAYDAARAASREPTATISNGASAERAPRIAPLMCAVLSSPSRTPPNVHSAVVSPAADDPARRRARSELRAGATRARARAHFRAMEIDPDRLDGPIVGIASTWTGTMPCNLNQRELARHVAAGVEAAGGVAL